MDRDELKHEALKLQDALSSGQPYETDAAIRTVQALRTRLMALEELEERYDAERNHRRDLETALEEATTTIGYEAGKHQNLELLGKALDIIDALAKRQAPSSVHGDVTVHYPEPRYILDGPVKGNT